MTVTREDLACRFCRHKVLLHNEIEGCTSSVCGCMGTPGEGWPRTITELETSAIHMDTALPSHAITPEPEHWPTSDRDLELVADWQYAVMNGDTLLGFRPWVAAQEEQA